MPRNPLRKFFPMMHGSSIDEEDIAPDTILEDDIADDAITSDKIVNDAVIAGKIAADALPDSAAIVKVFSPNAFDSAALVDVFADNSFNQATLNALLATGALDDDRLASFLVKEPGHIAGGRLDFGAVATAAVTVTIGGITYLEADAPTVTNGEWTNGASGNDSAVSLAAAINGDTRNSGGASFAAVVLTDTVFVFALVSGTAGNVAASVSADEPTSIENLVGGTAAAVKRQAHIMHTVTALEVAVAANAPEVLIPLPFDATFFSFQVYDSTGGIYATELTCRGTVVTASGNVPAHFRLANNGATDIQAGDIIRLIVQE